jgi:hypothetical protein
MEITSRKKKILPSTPRILKNNGNQKTSLASTFRYALCWSVSSFDTVHLWTKHGPCASENIVMLTDRILGGWISVFKFVYKRSNARIILKINLNARGTKRPWSRPNKEQLWESVRTKMSRVTTVLRAAELSMFEIDTYWMGSKSTKPQSMHLCTWEYFVQFTIL